MKKASLFLTLFFGLLFSTPGVNAQVINTIAGNGTGSFSGDGGAATLASLNRAGHVILDASGNIFIADYNNNRIRKVDPSGVITTIAGTGIAGYTGDGGPAIAAKLNHPNVLVLDATGNMFFGDCNNYVIRKISTSGIISTVAGNGISGFSGDGGQATAAKLGPIPSVAVDPSGNLFISDYGNHRIRKVNTSGIISTVAGTGVIGFSGDGGPAIAAKLYQPVFVLFDPAGNYYIVDQLNNRVRKVTPAGIISTVVGSGASVGYSGDGGPATSAVMHYPAGMAIDAAGNMLICDAYNNVVRKVNTAGIISTYAGTGVAGFSGDGGPPVLAKFNQCTGVVLDAVGNIFISDCFNNRIREITIGNHVPHFDSGYSDTLSVCQNSSASSINTLLSVTDVDAGQTETWGVISAPVHGILSGFSTSLTSTGSSIVPAGLTYTPVLGYSGADSFKVSVFDGLASDTITIYVAVIPLPNAGIITGPTSLCIGSSITLTNAATGGVWSSSVPSVATVGSSSGIVSGVTAGTSIISYSVTNSCGTAIDTQMVTVNSLPNAGTITGPTSVCVGSLITLTDAATGGTWSSSNPAVATVGSSSGIVGGVTAGTSIISYSVTNSCGTAIDTQIVTVNLLPNAGTISGPTSVCIGSLITLTDAITAGTWSSSNLAVATVGTSGIVGGVTAGTSIISYSVTNSCGAAIDTQMVTVHPLPDAGIISSPPSLCVGALITLTTTVTGGIWSSSNTTVATINGISGVAYLLSAGTTTIVYTTLPDAFGCVNDTSVLLTSGSSMIVSSTLTQIKCNGDSNGGIDITVTNGSGSYQYTWSNGSTSPSIGSLTSGTYTVVVKDMGTNCVDTESYSLSMPALLDIESLIQNDLCSSGKGSINLVNVFGGVSPYTYLWSTGATTTEIHSLAAGDYTVSITDKNLCVKNFVITVADDSCNDVLIHDVITPNGDGKNDVWVIEGIGKYPGNTVQLFDKWGDIVFDTHDYSDNWGGEGKNGLLPDGTYFYLIKLNASNLPEEKNIMKGSLLIKR